MGNFTFTILTKVNYYRFLPINHLRSLLSSPIGWKSKQNLILEFGNKMFCLLFCPMGDDRGIYKGDL